MKKTIDLYGVNPSYFDYMLYWEAIREKIILSEKVMKDIHKEATEMIYGSEEYNERYEIYRETEEAKKYNQGLINERKKYAKNKANKGINLSH